ncbi:MAG: hypothetical protein KDD64_00850 [Bdellovibrionales bacterium]|nr:hypothetical protein [Bdellovibrionales bacterium]
MSSTKFNFLLKGFLVILFSSVSVGLAESPSLFDTPGVVSRALSTSTSKPWERSKTGVVLRRSALNSSSFRVTLPNGTPATAVQSSTRAKDEGEYSTSTTSGSMTNEQGEVVGSFTVSRTINITTGEEATNAIFQPDKGDFYVLEASSQGATLTTVDPEAYPDCGEEHDTQPFLRVNHPPVYPALRSAPATMIDVMVVYTADARDEMGGESEILALINQAVERANLSYQNSGMNLSINLVHTEEVNYDEESGSFSDNLSFVRNDEEIAALRDKYGADMVSLFRSSSSSICGIGYRPYSDYLLSLDSFAFTVVSVSCASGYLSFAHELGHNFGAHHDEANAGSSTPFAEYGYGSRWTGSDSQQYRSVMSYSPGTRVPYFSNPEVEHLGSKTGDADAANNALLISTNAQVVATYRENVVPPSESPAPQPEPENPGSGSESPSKGGGEIGGGTSVNCSLSVSVTRSKRSILLLASVSDDGDSSEQSGLYEVTRVGKKASKLLATGSFERGAFVEQLGLRKAKNKQLSLSVSSETCEVSESFRINKRGRLRSLKRKRS